MANKVTLCIVVVAISCFRGANGLQCYECDYATDARGNPVDMGYDSSCVSETLKDGSKYLVPCNSENSLGRVGADGKFVRKNFTGDMAPEKDEHDDLAPRQQKIYGCAKLVADGERYGDKLKLTSRGCVESYIEFKQGCNKKSVKEWKKGEDVWSFLIFFTVSNELGYDDDAEVTGCYCTGDKCNLTNSQVGPAFPAVLASGVVLAIVKNIIL